MFSQRSKHLKDRLLTWVALLENRKKSKKNWKTNGHKKKLKLRSKTQSSTIEKKIFLDIRKKLRSWTSSSSSSMKRSEISGKTLLPRNVKWIFWKRALKRWMVNWNNIIQSMLLSVTWLKTWESPKASSKGRLNNLETQLGLMKTTSTTLRMLYIRLSSTPMITSSLKSP